LSETGAFASESDCDSTTVDNVIQSLQVRGQFHTPFLLVVGAAGPCGAGTHGRMSLWESAVGVFFSCSCTRWQERRPKSKL